jgi:SAM-dependent methyltransferase
MQGFRSGLADVGTEGRMAAMHVGRMRLAEGQLEEAFGVRWEGMRLLDMGCGQLLRNALYFSRSNRVVAIDLEPPPRFPWVPDLVRLFLRSGPGRAFRTLGRLCLGVDRRYRRAVESLLGSRCDGPAEVRRMDCEHLDFEDSSFDGVYSFSTLQHVRNPERALREAWRVLRPGGCVYVHLHLYTSITGSDHPWLRSHPERVPPWAHLRRTQPLYEKDGLRTNRLRLAEWRDLFTRLFSEVAFFNVEGEGDGPRTRLTPDVRRELAEYSEEDLLTTTFIAIARKPMQGALPPGRPPRTP